MAQQANRWHYEYERQQAEALLAARSAGEVLMRIQEIVGFGNYKTWIEANFDGSYSTANRHKNVAERWPEIEPHVKNGLCSIRAAEKTLTEIKNADRPLPLIFQPRVDGDYWREDALRRIKAVMPGVLKESRNRDSRLVRSEMIIFQNERLWTFDEFIACSIPFPLGMDAEIGGGVNGHQLYDAIQNCDSELVRSFVLKGDLLIWGDSGHLGGLPLNRASTLPIEDVHQPASWVDLQGNLLGAIDGTMRCKGSVHIHPDWVEACDKRHLIRYTMQTGISEPVVLCRETVKKLMQTKGEFTEIAVTDRWVHFRNGEGLTVACRRQLAQYPDLSPYLVFEGRPFQFPESMRREAVKFAETFLDQKDDHGRLVRIDLRPGKVILRTRSQGWSRCPFPHDYDGDPITFYIAPELIEGMLGQELALSRSVVRFNGDGCQHVAHLGALHTRGLQQREGRSARRAVSDERVIQKPPFQYFGAKRKVAQEIWRRLGDVDNYIEPFFGSGAVLFGRKHWADRIETVNDIDDHLTNFWRAAKADPEGLAKHVDHPVSETDLLVRNRWLMDTMKERASWLKGDPDYYDVKAAAWWVWGISQWIGSGFCDSRPSTKLPHIGGLGMGIHRRRLHSKEALLEYFTAIATRAHFTEV